MVNDHRTETKINNAEKVLDGDIDELIQAYLTHGTKDEEEAAA
jgi:peptide chain release factor 2